MSEYPREARDDAEREACNFDDDSGGDCPSRLPRDGSHFYCTRSLGHAGKHVAGGGLNQVWAVWSAAPSEVSAPPASEAPDPDAARVEWATFRDGVEVDRGSYVVEPPPPHRSAEEPDPLELAYWQFDSLRKRKGMPMAERDAFKAAVRGMVASKAPAREATATGAERGTAAQIAEIDNATDDLIVSLRLNGASLDEEDRAVVFNAMSRAIGAARSESAAEVERLKERVGMATEFNVHGVEAVRMAVDGWVVFRAGERGDFKDFDEYLTPDGHWVRVVLSEEPPWFPTADAAFEALQAAQTRGGET